MSAQDWESIKTNKLITAYIPGSINGFDIKFQIDSGSDLTAISPEIAQQAHLYPLDIKDYATTNTFNGRISSPIIVAPLKLINPMDMKEAPEFNTAITINKNQPYPVISVNDVTKVFELKFTPGGFEITPLSRPFKKNNLIKKARLGWSSGWY